MDQSANIELSVILPAYLEEENLRILLPRLIQTLEKMHLTFEVIVVDTATPMDQTNEVCGSCKVTYVNRRETNSFGDAVRTGIATARGRRIIFMDSDGSHTPEFIPKLYQHADQADVVIASRYVKGGVTENPRHLIWMSLFLNWTYSVVLNLRCKDVSNSFKLYSAEQLKQLELTCDNFDIVEEILYKLHKLNKGLRIFETPFIFRKRIFGETKRNLGMFILTYLVTIVKLRLMPVRPKKPSSV